MYQIKSLGVVGGALGRNAKLKFQHRITEKSVFLIYQYTFWKFSTVNTINCNFAKVLKFAFEVRMWVLSQLRYWNIAMRMEEKGELKLHLREFSSSNFVLIILSLI